MSLASFAQEFRSICDAAIHRTLTVGSGLAQAVSLLLDHGNEKLLSLERSSPPTDPAVDPAEAEDPFWMAVMPDISSLLLLQVMHLHARSVLGHFKELASDSMVCPGRHAEAWVSGVLLHCSAKSPGRSGSANKHTTVTLRKIYLNRRAGGRDSNE